MDIQAPEFHPLIDEDENFLIELNGVKFPKVTKGVGSIPGMADLSLEMWKIWERPGLAKLSRAERKRTSGAEQNRTTERHVVKHQGPGGVRARFRQLPEVGWTSCCA